MEDKKILKCSNEEYKYIIELIEKNNYKCENTNEFDEMIINEYEKGNRHESIVEFYKIIKKIVNYEWSRRY